MKKKFILKLLLSVVFSISLNSCIHDEATSSSDLSYKEYTNKSLWKEDEKYIKNVMKVYQENENKIKKTNGTPYWDYATTLGSYDESFLMVPVIESGKVVFVLQVPRQDINIHFYYTTFQNQIDFFQALVFAKFKKAEDASETNKGSSCDRYVVSTWMPDSETNPDPNSGGGHWESHTVIRCVQLPDECIGLVGPNGECQGGGDGGGSGNGGSYPYPGDPNTPKSPCDKAKGILTNLNIQAKINELKVQAPKGGEMGVKFKADGTPSATINGGAHSVDLGDKTGYQGGYHNHTPSGIPMLSPNDIDQLLGFAKAQPTSNPINVTNAYLGMVAPNGMHYVIWFNGGYQDAIKTFSQVDLDNYVIRFQTRNGMFKPTTPEGYEKLFFKTINDMGLNGKVTLQRIESDGTIKTVTTNNSGTTTTATPCV